LGLKFDKLLGICDEVEEEQPKVFGPQIALDLREGSSIHDLGKPPVEDDGEVQVVEVIEEETPMEMGTGDKAVHEDVEMGAGETPVHRVEGGDSFFGDYPGDDFEKVGEINLEETPQTPSEPFLSIPSEETPSSAEPRRKRMKTLAGRTDLPWV